MERTYYYNVITPEDNNEYFYIYFTRKGKWCYLITVHSIDVAKRVVEKEQHTDDIHGLKPALYAIVRGGSDLEDNELHNTSIIVSDDDLI